MTQTMKAMDMIEFRSYGPLFIDDGAPQDGAGGPAQFVRKVKTVTDHFGTTLGNREQITVEFEDGTPGRVFELGDDVVVHSILPGTDIKSG